MRRLRPVGGRQRPAPLTARPRAETAPSRFASGASVVAGYSPTRRRCRPFGFTLALRSILVARTSPTARLSRSQRPRPPNQRQRGETAPLGCAPAKACARLGSQTRQAPLGAATTRLFPSPPAREQCSLAAAKSTRAAKPNALRSPPGTSPARVAGDPGSLRHGEGVGTAAAPRIRAASCPTSIVRVMSGARLVPLHRHAPCFPCAHYFPYAQSAAQGHGPPPCQGYPAEADQT